MIAALVEGVLPGVRSLRAPLIAGLLWTLLLWLIFAENVVLPDRADGWSQQAYALAAAAGPLVTAVVVTILMFVLGALATSATQVIGSIIGAIATSQRVVWQTHAWRAHLQLRRKKRMRKAELSRMDTAQGKAAETKRARVERELDETEAKLATVDKVRKGPFIPDTSTLRRILGHPPGADTHSLEFDLVEVARLQAIDQEIARRDLAATSQQVLQGQEASGVAAAERLRDEFHPDPLDALRALDESLFLQLDRERAERELRLAVSVPVIALAVYASIQGTPWALLLAAAGLLLFLQAAVARSAERARVLNLVVLKGLETPALRMAAATGRDEVRRFTAQGETTH